MDYKSSSDHLAGTLQHLYSHWESRRRAVAAQHEERLSGPPFFTITLAREAGTPDAAIAQEVGNRLGWQVYDHELLERIAQDIGLRTALLETMDERGQSWLTETFEAFAATPQETVAEPLVSEGAYVRHLIKTVLALGVHGECIIVGRGAAFILPAETTLRVRLVAPPEQRIALRSRQLGVSKRDAARQLSTIDRERTAFVREHFLRDPTDARNYDLVLNALRFPVAQSAQLIGEALHQLRASRTG
jgi:cytidylate kinase